MTWHHFFPAGAVLFRQMEWKNRKTHWYKAVSSQLAIFEGSLAELLRFFPTSLCGVLVFDSALPPPPAAVRRRLPTHNFLTHNLLTHNLSTHLSALTHNFLTHTTCSHTTCPHTTFSHTTYSHTTCPHTSCPHTTYSHTTYSHTTYPHTTCPHTTYSHTTCPHTTYSHTQLVHTQLTHTHNLSTPHTTYSHTQLDHTHNLSTPHTTYSHTQLDHTQLVLALGSPLGAAVAAGVGVAGVALGDIDLHFAWEGWHLVTSTVTLGGTYGTGLAPVARLALRLAPLSPHLCPPSLCVAGVALGDIDRGFAWQAWHLWH